MKSDRDLTMRDLKTCGQRSTSAHESGFGSLIVGLAIGTIFTLMAIYIR